MKAQIQKRCMNVLRRTVSKHRLMDSGERVLIAVSGGSDSVALLHLLKQLSVEYSLRLAIAHLNHGLRGRAADQDEAFVIDLADRLKIPYHTKRMAPASPRAHHPKASLEERARQARYAFFAHLCRQHGYDKVATGHQQQDNAEWILLNVIRGCGLAGICGIPYKRPLSKGQTEVIRPLMELTPEVLKAYLQSIDQPFREDATNNQPQIPRNRIRHGLLPYLEKHYNTNITQALHRLSRIATTETSALDDLQMAQWDTAVQIRANHTTIDLQCWHTMPAAIQGRLVRQILANLAATGHRMGYRHIRAVQNLATTGRVGARIDLPGKIQVVRKDSALRLMRHHSISRGCPHDSEAQSIPFGIEILGPGYWPIPPLALSLTLSPTDRPNHKTLRGSGQRMAFFDMDRLQFPLMLRNIQPGDRFQPLGMTGTKKVARFLMDRKVSAETRWQSGILLSGETIVWVVGHGLSAHAGLRPDTRRVLKAEIGLLKQQI